jgi:hypothetical protein
MCSSPDRQRIATALANPGFPDLRLTKPGLANPRLGNPRRHDGT